MIDQHQNKKYARKLLIILLCFFAVIIIANIILVRFASNSWNGLWVENAYEKGLNYNDTLEQKTIEHHLGWHILFSKEKTAPLSYTLVFEVQDRKQAPLTDLLAELIIKRITHTGYDQTITLHEKTPGTYETDINFPLKGAWQLNVTFHEKHSDGHMHIAQRIFVEE